MLLVEVMVQRMFGGGGTDPRYCHDVSDVYHADLRDQRDLTSSVVVANIRATTQRLEFI